MSFFFFSVIVLGIFFLEWRASKAQKLLTEAVDLLRQLRDAATRNEQDRLARQAAELKREALSSGHQVR